MATERIIGIDFGTSTSFVKVKRYIDGKPFGGDRFETKAMVFDGKGSIAVPTVVQRLGEQFWFGYEAEVNKPGGTIYSNFKVDLESKDPNARAIAKEMTQKFFKYIYEKYDEQRQYFGEQSDTERTLVSYPAKWNEETRSFMVNAARKAGFLNVRGMDEATAAIGAVMIQEADSLQKKGYLQADVPATILLIDMGAGTTDLAVCRYTAGKTPKNEIITTWPEENGNILFGGREIDELLCNTLTELLSQSGIQEQYINNFAKMRISEIKSWKEYTVSETLNRGGKVESCSVLDSIYMIMDITPPQFPIIDRQSFESKAHTYLKQYAELINGCIAHAAATSQNVTGGEIIDLIVLTGGHSQWYFAKDVLTGNLKSLGEVDLPQIRDNESRVLRLARPQETVSLGLV
jgi:molecular chaperone DnaK (HSP70)